MKEIPEKWSRPWIIMWAINSAAVIIAGFIMPPKPWAVVAALLFGVPEAIALLKKGDRFPPLTYVSAFFLPRWFIITAIGFLVGAIGASWLGFQERWQLAALLALFSWSQDHYDVTYSSRRKWLGSSDI